MEADVQSNQIHNLTSQLVASQAAEDRLTTQWKAAERSKQYLLASASQRDVQASSVAVERMQAQV